MDFFKQTGKMAIGSRLRMLNDKITEASSQIYDLYDTELKPKWFPVFFVLSDGETKTITSIAQKIGHTHPSVSNIIKEMVKDGLIVEKKDKADGRRNMVELSEKGKKIASKMSDQYTDVTAAIENISKQTTHDLWGALEEWEFLLSEKSLLQRVIEERKLRESNFVQIVDYEPKYQKSFRDLNEGWITTYFKMEEADYKALDNPEEYILNRGGYIFVALYKDEPLGVCALLKMNDELYDYELAKMAVSPKAQGKNIGYLLGQAARQKAIDMGASTIYLESNTTLKPAISLYHKLGFKKVAGRPTPYERCNIQMVLLLKE
ncbi:MAG: GNAT family N-acetyltransferase [Prevotella sp.]|jgi:DNA-binding MarR family transcriptional regulator/predicted GNAT family N-acyltransferase|nr:GNAT family N-acetyltransferase [Prevotella sp.]